MTSNTKFKSDDRTLEMGQIPGKEKDLAKSIADPGLIKGTNRLHAVMDTRFCFWTLKYEKGDVPLPLKGKFTTFQLAKDAAEAYFKTKGLEIIKVED